MGLRLIPANKEIYCREYLVPAECFPENEPVTLYAECTRTTESERDLGYYSLSFHFSVGDYATKSHLIGLCFGTHSMTQGEINRIIDEFAQGQMNELFFQLVSEYLEKEEMWENEMRWRDAENGSE